MTSQTPQNSQNVHLINSQSIEKNLLSNQVTINSGNSLNRTLTPTPPTNNLNLGQTTPTSSNTPTPQRATPGQPTSTPASSGSTPAQSTPMDLLKYLRNFLHTLLNLARNSVPDKYPLVRTLIQELLDDRIDPETFIKKIQIEKNPPSPSLVPFLKKAMNQWRSVNGNQSVPIERFLEMANTGTGQSTTPSTTQPTTQQQQQQQNQTALKPGTTQQVNNIFNLKYI